MAHEPFPNYPSLADAIEDAEKVTVRWGHDSVRHLSPGQVAAIVSALRANVSESAPQGNPFTQHALLNAAADMLSSHGFARAAMHVRTAKRSIPDCPVSGLHDVPPQRAAEPQK